MGAFALPTDNNQVKLGNTSVVEVLTEGVYNGSGFTCETKDDIFTGSSTQLVLKDTLVATDLSNTISKTQVAIANSSGQLSSTLTTGNLQFNNNLFNLTSSLSNSTLFISDSSANTLNTTITAQSLELADITSSDLSTLTNSSLSITNPTSSINSSLSNSQIIIDDTINNRDVNISSAQILYTDTASINTATLSANSLVLDSGTGISNIIYSSTGINGTDINIVSDANSSIFLNVGLNGFLYGINLPISSVGLPSNAIYSHSTGGHTFLAIVP